MQRDDADYLDWLTMRARGRFLYLTDIAARTGLPTGFGLALIAAFGHAAARDFAPISFLLETWFLTTGAVILTVAAGWAEWRWLERKFE